jgi:NAD(P)-dependent dehydrogenase (short-subunit alcohol dehydrogenase family)
MPKQIALVTGANKGIGQAVADQLARLGMTVYLGSRDLARGLAASETMRDAGDIRPLVVDVTDEGSVRASLHTIEAESGRLDVLVNNAGIAPEPGDALHATPEKIAFCFETNMHGPARLIQMALPLLRKSKAGRVVNVASEAGSLTMLSGDFGYPMPYAYCASKAGLNAATVLFAMALKSDGIKINAVSPGLVKTDLSHHMGIRAPAKAAAIIVKFVTLDDDGPTGGFFNEKGAVPW